MTYLFWLYYFHHCKRPLWKTRHHFYSREDTIFPATPQTVQTTMSLIGQGSAKLKSRNNLHEYCCGCVSPLSSWMHEKAGKKLMGGHFSSTSKQLTEWNKRFFFKFQWSCVLTSDLQQCIMSVYVPEMVPLQQMPGRAAEILREAHNISVKTRLAEQHRWDFSCSCPLT